MGGGGGGGGEEGVDENKLVNIQCRESHVGLRGEKSRGRERDAGALLSCIVFHASYKPPSQIRHPSATILLLTIHDKPQGSFHHLNMPFTLISACVMGWECWDAFVSETLIIRQLIGMYLYLL